MINAEVTAENKEPVPPVSVGSSNPSRTHEDQSYVQILVIFLQELFIKLFSHLAVILVETSTTILLSGNCILFRAARGCERCSG